MLLAGLKSTWTSTASGVILSSHLLDTSSSIVELARGISGCWLSIREAFNMGLKSKRDTAYKAEQQRPGLLLAFGGCQQVF